MTGGGGLDGQSSPARRWALNAFSVVADDLTGACDAIAALGRLGTVSLDLQGFALQRDPVAAIDLNVRDKGNREAEEEYRRAIAAATPRMSQVGALLVCKIDSRLRGPVEAAVSSLSSSARTGPIVICPALPEEGRRIVAGRLFEGAVASADLAGRLRAQGLSPQCVPLSAVRDRRAILREIETAPPATCLLPDAENRGDLDALAAALVRTGTPPSLACSSGLLRSLSTHREALRRFAGPATGGVIWIIGSPIALREADLPGIERIEVDPASGLSERMREHILDRLEHGASVLLGLPRPGARDTLDPAFVKGALQSIPREVMRASAIVASGGTTARAVMEHFGLNILELQGEILPGAPLCRAKGLGGEATIVLRSGGFGSTAPMARLAEVLQEHVRNGIA